MVRRIEGNAMSPSCGKDWAGDAHPTGRRKRGSRTNSRRRLKSSVNEIIQEAVEPPGRLDVHWWRVTRWAGNILSPSLSFPWWHVNWRRPRQWGYTQYLETTSLTWIVVRVINSIHLSRSKSVGPIEWQSTIIINLVTCRVGQYRQSAKSCCYWYM